MFAGGHDPAHPGSQKDGALSWKQPDTEKHEIIHSDISSSAPMVNLAGKHWPISNKLLHLAG
jgi:hypothetical protein